jgi:hypothetical protein
MLFTKVLGRAVAFLNSRILYLKKIDLIMAFPPAAFNARFLQLAMGHTTLVKRDLPYTEQTDGGLNLSKMREVHPADCNQSWNRPSCHELIRPPVAENHGFVLSIASC